MHNNRETIETRICELLAQGHSLAAICRRKNLPAPSAQEIQRKSRAGFEINRRQHDPDKDNAGNYRP